MNLIKLLNYQYFANFILPKKKIKVKGWSKEPANVTKDTFLLQETAKKGYESLIVFSSLSSLDS